MNTEINPTNAAEANAYLHRTLDELNKLPQIKLELKNPPAFLKGATRTVFWPRETPEGIRGFVRQPRTGEFVEILHLNADYKKA